MPNIWPAVPAGFAPAATTYYRAMDQLIVFLMRLAALALRVDEAFFDDKVDRSIGTMRLNYYPAQAVPPVPGQLRASAHTDYGGFTILAGEDVPGGLQVLTRAGQWVDVATTPENFVVNIGDLLMRWTNDRWLSNMHRVVNPPLGGGPSRPRLSIAFFNHPNYDALIECLPSQGAAKHPPVLSGEYRDLKYSKTGLAAAGASAPHRPRGWERSGGTPRFEGGETFAHVERHVQMAVEAVDSVVDAVDPVVDAADLREQLGAR